MNTDGHIYNSAVSSQLDATERDKYTVPHTEMDSDEDDEESKTGEESTKFVISPEWPANKTP